MSTIDSRLISSDGEPEINENFNRTLELIDANVSGYTKDEVDALLSVRYTKDEVDTLLSEIRNKLLLTVNFDSDGGSAVGTQYIIYNNLATEPTNPTKEGYTFAGWNLDSDLFEFTTEITSHITLIAQWTLNE